LDSQAINRNCLEIAEMAELHHNKLFDSLTNEAAI